MGSKDPADHGEGPEHSWFDSPWVPLAMFSMIGLLGVFIGAMVTQSMRQSPYEAFVFNTALAHANAFNTALAQLGQEFAAANGNTTLAELDEGFAAANGNKRCGDEKKLDNWLQSVYPTTKTPLMSTPWSNLAGLGKYCDATEASPCTFGCTSPKVKGMTFISFDEKGEFVEKPMRETYYKAVLPRDDSDSSVAKFPLAFS
eukprot:477772_1